MERRLAAVLSAHMVGYSRLMEQDEERMLLGQKAHRRDAIDPEIASRGGRMVKTTGDGLLVEFASVQEAARCAIEIHSSIANVISRPTHGFHIVSASILAIVSVRTATYAAMASM